ncbi:MAG: hypothetical protein HGA44_16205 [Cellulomonadaceae bacterium]|nr:hypothetical protein [Cellulomonadaceae bacterium]
MQRITSSQPSVEQQPFVPSAATAARWLELRHAVAERAAVARREIGSESYSVLTAVPEQRLLAS